MAFHRAQSISTDEVSVTCATFTNLTKDGADGRGRGGSSPRIEILVRVGESAGCEKGGTSLPNIRCARPTMGGVPRCASASCSSFEIIQVVPEGSDGIHDAELIHYIAVEPGEYLLPDRTR